MARLRCLRAITHLIVGPRGEHLTTCLHQAERDEAALVRAATVLTSLPPLVRRHVLAAYGRIA